MIGNLLERWMQLAGTDIFERSKYYSQYDIMALVQTVKRYDPDNGTGGRVGEWDWFVLSNHFNKKPKVWGHEKSLQEAKDAADKYLIEQGYRFAEDPRISVLL